MKKIIILYLFLNLTNFSIAEIHEEILGKSKGYPSCHLWLESNDVCKVGTFSNPHANEDSFVISQVNPSPNPIKLKYTSHINKDEIEKKLDIENYLNKQRATSLMIISNNEIFVEKYQYARTAEMHFKSFSMSKSIISVLAGIALEKGFISSLDDKAEIYIPEIAGTAYGETTIRNFLRMSSGVEFNDGNENYGTTIGDMNKFFGTLLFKPNGKNAIAINAKLFNKRKYKQGMKFYYSSADTEFLTRIVVNATKKNITQLTQEWIWNPIGAEDSAYWLVYKSDNIENGSGGFYATLRDYAKFAIMLANDGNVDGNQVVSKKYLIDATDSDLQPNGFKSTQAQFNDGYGYQFWIIPIKERTFAMKGIYGQNIIIQPSSKIVMIQTSVYEKPAGDPSWNKQTDLFKSAIKFFGVNPN